MGCLGTSAIEFKHADPLRVQSLSGLNKSREEEELRRLMVLVAVVALAGLMSSASNATQKGFKWVTHNNYAGPFYGTRATITAPDYFEASVVPGDWFASAVQAHDAINNAITQGITFEWAKPQQGCNWGSSSAALYVFTESIENGVADCEAIRSAAWGDADLESVMYTPDNGLWHGYLDHVWTGTVTSWTNCYGQGCDASALGEESADTSGFWKAKFGGVGVYPWQILNFDTYPSDWINCCNGLYSVLDLKTPDPNNSAWTVSNGGYPPDGMWYWQYSNSGGCGLASRGEFDGPVC